MQALKVRRLPDGPLRYYLDGKRVTQDAWDAAHWVRRIDTLLTRVVCRKSIAFRQHSHCIRIEG